MTVQILYHMTLYADLSDEKQAFPSLCQLRMTAVVAQGIPCSRCMTFGAACPLPANIPRFRTTAHSPYVFT